jgi:phosphoglycerate dehydrogenase-like enzyme
LTGHISWSSPDGTDPLLQAFLDNLDRYLRGEELHGLVDPAEKY